MKTIQINEKLLAAAKEYIAYIETPPEPDITEVEQLEDEEHEPSPFAVLGKFMYELAQAIVEAGADAGGRCCLLHLPWKCLLSFATCTILRWSSHDNQNLPEQYLFLPFMIVLSFFWRNGSDLTSLIN